MNIWIDKLEKDHENWILYDSDWIRYWKYKDPQFEFMNYNNKGFIFLQHCDKMKYNDCNLYLSFAYVHSECRKQGILKKMMNMINEKYPYKRIYLNSYDSNTDKIWKKVGFELYLETKKGICNVFKNKRSVVNELDIMIQFLETFSK